MKLLIDKQINPVQSEVLSRISVVRPILTGILMGIKQDIANELGGYENIKLKMLPRSYRPGDGDIGVCFEWAVHDAIRRKDPAVIEKLADAAKKCKLPGGEYRSILFGVEKNGKSRIIDTAKDILTDESRILTGERAQPLKLKGYMNMLSAAFNRPETRAALPYSINGLWKADLFFGTTDNDRWLGTTLKINKAHLEGAKGLRIGIVPSSQGKADKIIKDDKKNLIICPLPYDGAFMELFYTGWRIVQQFISADAMQPKEAALPSPADRQVAKELEMRREFSVMEVVQILEAQSQRELLTRIEQDTTSFIEKEGESVLNDTIVAPVAMNI
ncbi:hypothetical protein [Leptospira adleri]|uniref:Uncharacterized protein n=1 Tax=Leptospira adleri TaxID=2023186 RepID=A0ABX4NS24_9LEPT|nr:hypothetical protein [Leptospira adleri]PJZ59558.1 hypothetical protein CH376_23090 [Leptospira adleri]